MNRQSSLVVMAFALGVVANPAVAEVGVESVATPASATGVAADIIETPKIAFDTVPLDETALQAQAGRQDTAMIAKSESAATVTRNSIGANSKTGEIGVADQAFQNLSGLSLININSGNNVAINSSMNVNISITPGQ